MNEEVRIAPNIKPWIQVTLDDFKRQFGEGITGRVSSKRKPQPKGDLIPKTTGRVIDSLPSSSLPTPEPAFDLEERFAEKAKTLSSYLQHAVLQGLQGSVYLLKKIDPSSDFLKKMLLDLIAWEFLIEIGTPTEQDNSLSLRLNSTREHVENWEQGREAVRLPSLDGDWVDSHPIDSSAMWS